MKNMVIAVLLSLVVYVSNAQTGDPYYLGFQDFPELKLPPNLSIDGIDGKIIVHLKLDSFANILSIEWIVLLLKNDKGKCFIHYREAVNKGFTFIDYPLPIRPYFEIIQEKIKELSFVRDERIPRPDGDWYFTIPYKVH